MNDWIADYLAGQKKALDSISAETVAMLKGLLSQAVRDDRQIFFAGNGGSAANASHIATDLGKGASDKLPRRFRCLSLNDNVSWITALGNDYNYEEIFVGQLRSLARSGDVLFLLSVSGNSPNLVKAAAWARENGLVTIALLGGGRGRLAEVVEHAVAVDSTHYGQVEDAHMTICHLLAYSFIDQVAEAGKKPAAGTRA